MDAKTIGARVAKYRKAAKWNAEDLAYHAKLSRPTIDNVESGAHMPNLGTLAAIAEALRLDVTDLLHVKR